MPSRFSLEFTSDTTKALRRRLHQTLSDCPPPGVDAREGGACMACALFLERETPLGGQSGTRRTLRARVDSVAIGALNGMVRRFSGSPGMLHVELLLVSPTGEFHHFATYLGDEARWRDEEGGYYTMHQWRAIPIDGNAAHLASLASACDAAVGTPYSVARYPCSTRAFGWLSRFVSDRAGSPAHCAGLTSRLVRTALGEHGTRLLPRRSPRYSPSDLYNDLVHNAALMTNLETHCVEGADPESGPVVDQMIDALVHGPDRDIAELSMLQRAVAIKAMSARLAARLVRDGENHDAVETRNLAWAAVRASGVPAMKGRSSASSDVPAMKGRSSASSDDASYDSQTTLLRH